MTPRERILVVILALQLLGLQALLRRDLGLWQADRILKAVESSTTQAVAARQVTASLLVRNADWLGEAEGLSRASASIRLARGSQYLLLGRPEPAIQAYLEALRLEPRPEIYLNLGRAEWQAGRRTEALRRFELAVRLDPSLRRGIPSAAAGLVP